ncbi:hypothetical protein [Microbaculum marinisediminis]|uniref:Uncharacterized protein n=1 Tax=Microbaculum marinisediminis TaxID=2931392 RepID=A0AAW5QZH0_9HYPH|nr:hypothetical protein [Microbaculum sp. A6E488]MCT8971821.1 hypothetical protein [Microbaculum sp. A6E488]
MTAWSIAKTRVAGVRHAGDAAGLLGLAASPTFALMAWVSASTASQASICFSAPTRLPIGGMVVMYLLMSLFHLAPWLRLASGHSRQRPQDHIRGD